MKHFTKQNSSLCSLHGKIGIQMNNTVYTSKEKNQFSFFFFLKTLPLQNIVPHLMFIIAVRFLEMLDVKIEGTNCNPR